MSGVPQPGLATQHFSIYELVNLAFTARNLPVLVDFYSSGSSELQSKGLRTHCALPAREPASSLRTQWSI